MKKSRFFAFILIFALALALCTAMVACGYEPEPEPETPELSFEQVYAYAQEAGYTGTLEELI